ncbi:MAG: acyl-CoA dehydrogenase family protein [Candidatus Bipolaricaulota bacterium]|nr:acyl-CoA dehydrogenase family protein [Candidatus Bipolaricaulota bacterium]MCS7275008.1 acyl-CoA dehydrogenase family protein [Candidatus Bipolaricaulota bacterium]MDW8110527.1 acyl-CoA dehydrogenase family protein [Candidatus Bipolaricaulota bacterium]MDW8329322.1 acyl-CoA dehydrogenase family protein [Candidatus Bipolaricaulota bacterium]
MVDFTPTEETRLLVRGLRSFLEREIRPLEERYREYFEDERKRLQDDGSLVPEVKAVIDRVRRRSGELGYYGMHMPEDVGGGGVNRVGLFFAQKEVWRHGLGLNAYILAGPEGPSPMLLHLNEAQRKKYLYPLVKGEITTCFALTEPEAGSDIKNLKTRAEKRGDYYILNGLKTFITNAAYADFAQVFAVTDPKLYKESGYSGVTAFIVDRHTPGYRVGRIHRSILDDGSQAELILENCKVPKENVIGEEQRGFYVAMSWIGSGRLNIAGMCVGLGEYLLKESVEYATQRTAFGKPIAKYQHIRGMLADSAAELYACEQLVLNCAWRLDQGEPIIKESAIAKYFATNMLYRLADRAVQIHGGMGVMKELPIERVFKLARVLRIVEGTDEIQKETIAKSLGL